MASYTLRGLTADTVARAKARARDAGTSLDDVLRDYLQTYADPLPRGVAGARARADALSPERRTDIARQAALARHHRSTTG